MKISYNWLKQYIKLNQPADEVAKILTSIGLEVESVETVEAIKGGLKGVVVGYVLTCVDHPDSDHLHITTVEVGTGEPLQIVCGAPNVAAGQKVPVATIGTTLYFSNGDEVKIKKGKIRGVESFGMICAEDELGLGEGHEGIMVLSVDAVPGTPLSAYYKLENDYVFEIGLTPNRIDAASHIGVARDLAAYFKGIGENIHLTYPTVDNFKVDNTSNPYQVEVLNPEACTRYSGITISNVTVGESPDWLKKRLLAIGLRPINNVVDITNFILQEQCQPLHAFDADKIDGKKVVVRTLVEGTPFVTLDGVERKLSDKDLMICSATQPMCIGGVFGGLDSGVTTETKNIFLESACFNSVSVRKTARRHGLNTDSSFRFERGVDPNNTVYVLKRAAMLIKELCGGEISSDIVDIYPEKVEPTKVTMTYDYINRLVGKDIPKETIENIFSGLEMKVEKEHHGEFTVAVPTYRVDVKRPADVVEDILRLYGYNNIEIPLHVNSTLSYVNQPDKDQVLNVLSNYLSANGFNEIMSNSLTKGAYYEGLTTFPAENSTKILNPLSNDLNVLRQTLLFNGLEAINNNINHRNPNLKLYEFGNVYRYDPSKEDGTLKAYSEEYRFTLFLTGAVQVQQWNKKDERGNYFHLQSYVEQLMQRLGYSLQNMPELAVEQADLYSEAVTYSFENKPVVTLGIVSKQLLARFDCKQDVYVADFNWAALMKMAAKNKVLYTELPKFPEVRRDLALVLDKEVTYTQVRQIAFKAERKWLKRVSLFDVYEGDKLPQGKKSYAVSFILRDTEKTLTDQEIDRSMQNLLKAFEREVGASLR